MLLVLWGMVEVAKSLWCVLLPLVFGKLAMKHLRAHFTLFNHSLKKNYPSSLAKSSVDDNNFFRISSMRWKFVCGKCAIWEFANEEYKLFLIKITLFFNLILIMKKNWPVNWNSCRLVAKQKTIFTEIICATLSTLHNMFLTDM